MQRYHWIFAITFRYTICDEQITINHNNNIIVNINIIVLSIIHNWMLDFITLPTKIAQLYWRKRNVNIYVGNFFFLLFCKKAGSWCHIYLPSRQKWQNCCELPKILKYLLEMCSWYYFYINESLSLEIKPMSPVW